MANKRNSKPKVFKEGQPVKYVSQGIMESMKFTRLVGYFDTTSPPKIGKRTRYKGEPRKQKRYIIEHLYGFLPTNQPILEGTEVLESLDRNRKYIFAYQDELFPLDEKQYSKLRNEQNKKHKKA